MGVFTLRLEFDNEEQVLTALSRFGEYSSNLSEPFDEIADDFKDYMDEVFDSEGGTNGATWAALNPRYAAWKDAHGGGPTLYRTGALRESLTGGAGFIREITSDTMVVGTSIPYSVFHQRGTSRMPQRKIVAVPKDVRTRWAKIVQKWLVSFARAAGLEANGGGGL